MDMARFRMSSVALVGALGLSAGAVWAAPAKPQSATPPDVYSARDYHGLPRFEGGRIRAYRVLGNSEILLPQATIANRSDEAQKTLRLQGEITHIDYVIRPSSHPQDIDRYYESLLRDGGYETVFNCTGSSACGSRMGPMILNEGTVAPIGFADGIFNDQLRVRVARKGATWVLLHMIQGPDRALVYQAVIDGARELE